MLTQKDYEQHIEVLQKENADLIEALQAWSEIFGEALMLYLQGDTSKIDDLSKHMKIAFGKNGPYLECDALKRAGVEV